MILSAQNLHLGNANVNLVFEHGIISPAYKVYELNKCDQYFVQSWVKKDSTKDFFLNATTEGASQCRKNIDWYILNNQLIVIPSLYEQIRIGKLFDCLNHLITLHQSKSFGHILEEIVSCALSWEQRKLGDICQITMGQSPDGSTYSETTSDYILVQGNADLKDGWVYPRIWTTQKTKMAYVGDLIMSVRAPAGTMGKTYYDVVIGRGVAGIKGSEFIYQALVKMDSGGYWKILAAGSTFESINSDVVNGAELMVTENVDEQNRIGDCFASIDHLITLHQLEPFQLIFKAIAYRIIDYAKSKPPRYIKYEDII